MDIVPDFQVRLTRCIKLFYRKFAAALPALLRLAGTLPDSQTMAIVHKKPSKLTVIGDVCVMNSDPSASASPPYDPNRKIACTPDELRVVFAGSKFAPIAAHLDYLRYFPRSVARAMRQQLASSTGSALTSVVFGAAVGGVVHGVQTNSMSYVVGSMVLALLALAAIRTPLLWSQMHARMSEDCKFIELLAFEERKPVIYLRPFDGENPMLSTMTRCANGELSYTSAPPAEPLENVVDTVLGAIGPVVGLGRPGDTFISQRIFRLYVNQPES
jgi:hypothetical protein